jgi:hypothetical protein
MPNSTIPTEVELAFEIMPCQAARFALDVGLREHPCSYFRKWGTYHSFDYEQPGPPKPGTTAQTEYLGRARLVPEMLSGCRKAPIMAVGINPNLPGWWPNLRASLNPLFDDFQQYAHYFRYRRTSKPELSAADYTAFGGSAGDEPLKSGFQLNVPKDASEEATITVQWREQKMYAAYQSLLDGLAQAVGWPAGRLQVGEDLSYGNMVHCPSAKWTTKNDPTDPLLPPMKESERRGIVGECFGKRRYFLRQLFQSLPTVLFVFSQNTANAFIQQLQGRFSAGNPKPDESVAALMTRETVLHFGDTPDGVPIDARVIFAPHPTGNEADWVAAKPTVIQQLVACVQSGRLQFNPTTSRLTRPVGSCVVCTMLGIGPRDYKTELRPLAAPPGLAGAGATLGMAPDKPLQTAMLSRFVAGLQAAKDAWKNTDDLTPGP